MEEPKDIHEWVKNYNWDDGIGPVREIIQSAETAFATALMIYWRLGGPWLESDQSEVNAVARELALIVKKRLLAGFYRQASFRYDPVADNGLSKTQVYRLTKDGLPALLITPDDTNKMK